MFGEIWLNETGSRYWSNRYAIGFPVPSVDGRDQRKLGDSPGRTEMLSTESLNWLDSLTEADGDGCHHAGEQHASESTQNDHPEQTTGNTHEDQLPIITGVPGVVKGRADCGVR